MSNTQSDPLFPDTSSTSVLHQLTRRLGRNSQTPKLARVYLLLVAVTYVPLLFAVLWAQVPLWDGDKSASVAFFQDWGIAFALIVSLPSIMVLLASDEFVLF